jgi:hypothetical protein
MPFVEIRPFQQGPAWRHFAAEFLQFVAFPSQGSVAAPRVRSTTRNHPQEPQMITAFFLFVTTAFFAAIVANVVESIGTTRAYA